MIACTRRVYVCVFGVREELKNLFELQMVTVRQSARVPLRHRCTRAARKRLTIMKMCHCAARATTLRCVLLQSSLSIQLSLVSIRQKRINCKLQSPPSTGKSTLCGDRRRTNVDVSCVTWQRTIDENDTHYAAYLASRSLLIQHCDC